MNVRQLIEELEKIENKELPVKWRDRYGMGGDCCSKEDFHYHFDYNEPSLEDVDCIYEELMKVATTKRGKIVYEHKTVVVIGDY